MRWGAVSVLVALCLCVGGAPLLAEETATPFDMTPERGSEPALPSASPATPAPPAPLPPSEPADTQVPASSPAEATPPAPPPALTAAQKVEAGPKADAVSKDDAISKADAVPSALDRPILPYRSLVLEGELDGRAWNVVLTKDQAASPVTLTVGYKASVVVAPEASRLSLFVNNQSVFDAPIAASDQLGKLSVDLPAGLLQAGPNLFRIQAIQRHRTDCTVGSTYELRTQIDSATSALHFRSPTADRLARIEDLAATSPDATGVARLRIVVPALRQRVLIGPVMRFAEAASILIGMPSQTISVVDKPEGAVDPSMVTAVVGTAEELRPLLRTVPAEAASRPIVTFVDDPTLGPSTLVISGPSAGAVSQAVDAIGALVDRPRGVARDVLDTSRWFAPNAPLFLGAGRTKLSALGVATQEFAGRRFKTEFQVGIPSDFYAVASGEATLLLDAAYSGEVLPGSHLDVYVNDDIAATTPMSTSGGEILRHLPIRIPMTHFRPGANRITFEAQLHTTSDTQCAAGPAKGDNRFVLFDTSELVIPDFARIAQMPNLAALQGTAFPYNSSADPIALVLGRYDPDILSAAATLLGRMAVSAGRLIAVDPDPSPDTLDGHNTIFVAPAPDIPSTVSGQLDLDGRISSSWKVHEDEIETPAQQVAGNALGSATATPPAISTAEPADTQETFDRWRQALSTEGGGWRGNVSSFEDWLQRTFQLSSASLRFLPSRAAAYLPSRESPFLIVQGPSVSGDRAWTLLTAPTSGLLRQGANTLTADAQWPKLAGRLVSYNAKLATVQALPVTTFSFIPTQPTTFANLRLIAANWLSENILAFSLLLFTTCLLLGLATALFLSHVGRRGST